MANITHLINIQLDPTRPAEELAQAISYILLSSPVERHKAILEALDLEIGNALANLAKSEKEQEDQAIQENKK